MKRYANATSVNLKEINNSSVAKIAGQMKSKKEIITKKGDRMAFIVLEDLEGSVEVTVFSDLYAQSGDLLQEGEPLLITGTREGDADNPKVLAQEIYHIDEVPRHLSNGLHIRINTAGVAVNQISELKQILKNHKGKQPVTLHVIIPQRTETIIHIPSIKVDPSDDFVGLIRETFGHTALSFEWSHIPGCHGWRLWVNVWRLNPDEMLGKYFRIQLNLQKLV